MLSQAFAGAGLNMGGGACWSFVVGYGAAFLLSNESSYHELFVLSFGRCDFIVGVPWPGSLGILFGIAQFVTMGFLDIVSDRLPSGGLGGPALGNPLMAAPL